MMKTLHKFCKTFNRRWIAFFFLKIQILLVFLGVSGFTYAGKVVRFNLLEDKTVDQRSGFKKEMKRQSESIKISGMVRSQDGTALPGVSVAVKGSLQSVVTDSNGQYSLKLAQSENIVLVFSIQGMQSVEYRVESERQIDIVLTPIKRIETGYQRVEHNLFVGTATSLNASDVKNDGEPDASKFLQGQAAGVFVDDVSGTFGVASAIRIRGNTSLYGKNRPLWVIDGVVQEELISLGTDALTSGDVATVLSSGMANLNPADIDEIHILKDVAATAIYGSRAMNGVVVVKTKDGASGKLRVSYSGNVSIKQKPQLSNFKLGDVTAEKLLYEELCSKGWVGINRSQRAKNHGIYDHMFQEVTIGGTGWGMDSFGQFLSEYEKENTDWFNVLFKNSVVHQHSFSFSGGSANANFYASVNYYCDEGITIADNVTKYTGSLRGEFQLSDKLSVGVKITGLQRKQKLPGAENKQFDYWHGIYERNFEINPFNYALKTSRHLRPYDKDGELEYYRRNYTDFNIINELNRNFVEMSVTDIAGQIDLNYEILNGLDFSVLSNWRQSNAFKEHIIHEETNYANAYRAGTAPYDSEMIRDRNPLLYFDPDRPFAYPYSVLPSGGFYNTGDNELNSYFARATVGWNKSFSNSHYLSVLAGHEISLLQRSERRVNKWGIEYEQGRQADLPPFFSKYLEQNNLTLNEERDLEDRSMGTFLNANYSYDKKYILNGVFRRDASNMLDKNVAPLISWSLGGRWNIDKESFWKESRYVDLFSIRGAYGLVGGIGLSAVEVWNLEENSFMRPYDVVKGRSFAWEKMNEFNIGLEAAFFNNRIYTDLSYFNRKSFDLLSPVKYGVEGRKRYINSAEFKSKGFEFTLKTVNVKKGSFAWISTMTVGYNANEILKLQNSDIVNDFVSNRPNNYKDRPVNGLYSLRFDGLTNDGLPTFVDEEGNQINSLSEIRSSNEIMKYLKYEGLNEAPLSGGFTNEFKYRAFSLGMRFVFRFGNKIKLDDFFDVRENGFHSFGYSSVNADLKNRYQNSGDETKTNVPVIVDYDYQNSEAWNNNVYEMYNKSDVRFADGSFVRLRTVVFGYGLPDRIVKRLGLRNVDISIQGENLWLAFSDEKLNGLDPEFVNSGGVAFPNTKRYTFAVNINF